MSLFCYISISVSGQFYDPSTENVPSFLNDRYLNPDAHLSSHEDPTMLGRISRFWAVFTGPGLTSEVVSLSQPVGPLPQPVSLRALRGVLLPLISH